MVRLKSKRYLLAAILGGTVFLVAFGIALAATVFQATRQVPSDLIFSSVLVQNEKLGVFPTADATGAQVSVLHFRGAALQPPLRPRVASVDVFVKNLSTDTPFTLVEPCRDILATVSGTGSEVNIGHMSAPIFHLDGRHLGNTCDSTATVAPQQVVRAFVHMDRLAPGLATDVVRNFSTVFGAVGETSGVSGLGTFQQLPDRNLGFLHPNGPGVRVGDFHYIISGAIASRGVFTPQIERTHITPDGGITVWEVAATLPAARDQAVAAATQSNIYIIGNHPGSTVVQRVPVSGDGSLGSAVTDRPFQNARYGAGAMVHRGYLYIIGGNNNSLSPPSLASVERATINADGSLGLWENAPALNIARSNFALAVTDRYVWVLGGGGATGGLGSVERAELRPDGTIGSWQVVGTVPVRSRASAIATDGCIFYVGGDAPTGLTKSVHCVRLNSSGDIVGVEPQPDMTIHRHDAEVFRGGDFLYVTGGAGDDNVGGLNGWTITERAPIHP